jgi:predicted anti-sigma-YlaC factor YlaD
MSELVTDYLERRVPPRLNLDMRWHLWRCPACRAYFGQMRQLVRLMRRAPGETPGAEAEARLVARMRQSKGD